MRMGCCKGERIERLEAEVNRWHLSVLLQFPLIGGFARLGRLLSSDPWVYGAGLTTQPRENCGHAFLGKRNQRTKESPSLMHPLFHRPTLSPDRSDRLGLSSIQAAAGTAGRSLDVVPAP